MTLACSLSQSHTLKDLFFFSFPFPFSFPSLYFSLSLSFPFSFFPVHLCVNLCLCVHMLAPTHVYVCTGACVSKMPIKARGCCWVPFSIEALMIWDRVSSWTWSLWFHLSSWSVSCRDVFVSASLVQRLQPQHLAFIWVVGIWTQVLMVAYRALIFLSHAPSLVNDGWDKTPAKSWHFSFTNFLHLETEVLSFAKTTFEMQVTSLRSGKGMRTEGPLSGRLMRR